MSLSIKKLRHSLLLMLMLVLPLHVYAAIADWPADDPDIDWPEWVGVSLGTALDASNNPGKDRMDDPASSDHTGFDYGMDKWGIWANMEVDHPVLGVVIIEMRYVEINDKLNYGQGDETAAFYMGAPFDEQGAQDCEKPPKRVLKAGINSGKDYLWVAAEECSQAVWEAVLATTLVQDLGKDPTIENRATVVSGLNPSRSIDSQTIGSAKLFCDTLRSNQETRYGLGANTLAEIDLPSEVEWEYLCRAGTATAFFTGRLLSGVGRKTPVNIKVNISKNLYNYDRAEMDANAVKTPYGDPAYVLISGDISYHNKSSDPLIDNGYTPPWRMKLQRIDVLGVGIFKGWDLKAQVSGDLDVVSGGLMVSMVELFDNRYQHRYAPDHFGSHTPVLMLYELVVGKYMPRPYGAPGVGMYYRYLDLTTPGVYDDPIDYVATSLLTMATGKQNHLYSSANMKIGSRRFSYHDGAQPGDWYDALGDVPDAGPRQLEYREMIRVVTRYEGSAVTKFPNEASWNSSGWVETRSGDFIKTTNYNGSITMHPIRSMYHPVRYNALGKLPESPLPVALDDADKIAGARTVVPMNQSGSNMSTDKYVKEYKQAIVDFYGGGPQFDAGFWQPGRWDAADVIISFNDGDLKIMDAFNSLNPDWIRDDIQVKNINVITGDYSGQNRNDFGLKNMHGNFSEWVATSWDGLSNHMNHQASANGKSNMTKGGSWATGADHCRSASRTARDDTMSYPDVSFRFIIRD